ncbi:MAG: MFS transporter [Candidatus Baldrarchaeia archaeon]
MLSDRLGKRKPFILTGFLIGSLLLFPFPFVDKPLLYATILGIHFVMLSAALPTWTTLIGRHVPEEARGRGLGKINGISLGARVLATLLSGMVMTFVVGETFIRM